VIEVQGFPTSEGKAGGASPKVRQAEGAGLRGKSPAGEMPGVESCPGRGGGRNHRSAAPELASLFGEAMRIA
jgi:hypothetical protein